MLDYNLHKDLLANTKNPFTIVVLAQLAMLETRNNPQARLFRKTGLTRQLFQRGMSSTEVANLYQFIDWILALPDEYEIQYHTELEKLGEEFNMPYMSTSERVGRRMGLQQGVLIGEAKVLLKLMEYKFNAIPESYRVRVETADEQNILKWTKNILNASNLAEVVNDAED